MELHARASLFSFVRPRMDRETMRSITDWSLLASAYQEPVPSHFTAAGSCAQVTRPGMTPRGTPNGERGSNKEDGKQLAAAIASANCRRVISILTCSSTHKILRLPRSSLPESAETGLRTRTTRVHFFKLICFPYPPPQSATS